MNNITKIFSLLIIVFLIGNSKMGQAQELHPGEYNNAIPALQVKNDKDLKTILRAGFSRFGIKKRDV